MVQVEWAEPALDDLRSIHDYIRRDSPRYARVMVDRVLTVAGRLSEFPVSGSILPELLHSGYRQVLVGSYRVIYRYDEAGNRVLIVAVVHASRDLRSVLRE